MWLRLFPIAAAIVGIIYTAVCVVQADSNQTRYLPKSVWLLLVLALPILGAIAWWSWGRPLIRQ
ncbi:MAG: PLDc N-terminal domain-containing protein [Propionibacteriaceae bacterium]|nr:PLDc N-terminal domain-containing protein [Propionibacteriaceae bacterium]